jgi:DNA polymerase-3 subunit delta'
MQKGSANAMLKILEEPPAGTLMLLLTERIHAVLPTIVSRCQILRSAYLAPELLRSQLITRFSLQPDDHRLEELVYTGSLGQALYLLRILMNRS